MIADTKFEFGLDRAGRLVLGDEALTPDSSRFWPADQYAPGVAQPSFDKQFVRDYCEQTGWDKTPPGPELPPEVVSGTRARYVEPFERLTSIGFDDYLTDPTVVLRERYAPGAGVGSTGAMSPMSGSSCSVSAIFV